MRRVEITAILGGCISSTTKDLDLMAYLMRRARFGATRPGLEAFVRQGYENTLEELLNPTKPRSMPEDLIRRYHVNQSELWIIDSGASNWIYRLFTTTAPLEEKNRLFCHSLFATGECTVNNCKGSHRGLQTGSVRG